MVLKQLYYTTTYTIINQNKHSRVPLAYNVRPMPIRSTASAPSLLWTTTSCLVLGKNNYMDLNASHDTPLFTLSARC